MKAVHFSESTDSEIFLTTIVEFAPGAEDNSPVCFIPENIISVLLSATTKEKSTLIMLDTQASVHLMSNSELLSDVNDTCNPITVQGITGDRTKVTSEGIIHQLGITAYYNPSMAANILSYHKLQDTHRLHYDERSDTFVATPFYIGPDLVFTCRNGHYVLDLDDLLNVYMTTISRNAARYGKRQLQNARKAYDFIVRMGFISYKSAAEVVQRGSMTELGFTRADLVNAQDIYGTPAAYQLGQGTQKSAQPSEDDPIPTYESVEQELQIDLFYFLGQVFFISISVLLGLIMVTHLGPGIDRSNTAKANSDRQGDGARSKARRTLITHIQQYVSKGFAIKRVTSDGEPSIKAVRPDVEAMGVEMNILGHGSHTFHAEAAIRHIKNKACSTMHSLPYALPSKLAAALITIVVHTANMVPKVNAIGHLPAHTAFLGRIPNFAKDAPYAFGTAGFLQRASNSAYNTDAARGDYCIWLGTTHNLAGTHRCLNLDSLREITGDVFRPSLITDAAILRLAALAGENQVVPRESEPALQNPAAPYQLDPNRGVQLPPLEPDDPGQADIVTADSVAANLDQVEYPEQDQTHLTEQLETRENSSTSYPEQEITIPTVPIDLLGGDLAEREGDLTEQVPDRTLSQVTELVEARNAINGGYDLHKSTRDSHVYATLSIQAARKIYGKELSDKATTEELLTCIQKDV